MEPEDHGYEKVGEKGPLTRFEKQTEDGRMVVYHTPEGSVRVNETARTPNVVETSPEFFWRDSIGDGSLYENERAETVEAAHEQAQARIESLMADAE